MDARQKQLIQQIDKANELIAQSWGKEHDKKRAILFDILAELHETYIREYGRRGRNK